MILLQVLALSFIHHLPRLFFVFTPFFIAYGIAFFVHLVDKLKTKSFNKNVVYAIGITLFIAAPLVRAITSFDENSDKRYTPEQIRYIKSVTSRKQVVATDIPSDTSWYADRVAIFIPVNPQMMEKIESGAPVHAVFLSSILNQWIEVDKEWVTIRDRGAKDFRDYDLQRRFSDGSLLYARQKGDLAPNRGGNVVDSPRSLEYH